MACNSELIIKKKYDLQALNTLASPSVAEYYTEVKQASDFSLLLDFVKENKCKLLVLGGGSNVLLPQYVSGLVAKISIKERKIISETDADVVIRFAAGEEWHAVVMWSVDQGYYGIENLALIPGSVGAAPIQNIGAYGVELESCCEGVEGILLDTDKKVQLTRDECQFSYRDSTFKHALKDNFIITAVTLRLSKIKKIKLTYPALQEKMKELNVKDDELTAVDIAKMVIEIRQSKLPDPAHIPNVGSFFKNPIVTKEKLEFIKDKFPDVVHYPLSDGFYKLAAGWLLDKAGWRGKVIDHIGMHDRQALVLVNPQKQTSEMVLSFAKKVRDSIRDQYNIELEIEPKIIS